MLKTLYRKLNAHHRAWAVAVLAAAFIIFYLGPNHLQLGEPRPLPLFAWEEIIPFLPWTIFIYFSTYLQVILAVLLFRRQDFNLAFSALIIMVILHGLIFVLFPTIYPRPPLPENVSIFTGFCYNFLIALDTPKNCFPSLHLAATVFVSLILWRRKTGLGLFFLFWTLLIALSTLTLKQHYFWDIAAGAGFGLFFYLYAFKIRKIL